MYDVLVDLFIASVTDAYFLLNTKLRYDGQLGRTLLTEHLATRTTVMLIEINK